MRPQWSPATKRFVAALLIGIFIYLIWKFSIVVPPLILALVLAYVLSPLVNRLQPYFRNTRALTTILVYIALIGLVSLLPILLIPSIIDQWELLAKYLDTTIQQLESLLDRAILIAGYSFNVGQLIEELADTTRGLLEPLFGQTLVFAFEVITSAVWVVFIFVVPFTFSKTAINSQLG